MTTTGNERPYLSIGEVLALLLEEFPDVTISKIRFLESQGLIEPERTASGYRKFFDADVERLRVILREQREHFLPLRVIRDRLENGEIDDSGGLVAPPRGIRNVRPAQFAMPTLPLDDTAGLELDDTSGFEIEIDPTGTISVHAGQVTTSHHPAAQLRPPALPPPPPAPAITAPAAAPSAGAPSASAPTATSPAADTEVAADHTAGELPGAGAPAATPSAAPASPPPLTIVPPPPAHAATATVAAVQRAATPEPEVPELFLRAELCAAAGLTSSQLTELESYGLLAGRGTGPNATYTQSDLAIANAAAGFMARGIEARHLRTWRQAAERETALFDQRILPLLRQRNPQARQDAVDLLNDLVELGGQLREAIVKAAVRHHVDP